MLFRDRTPRLNSREQSRRGPAHLGNRHGEASRGAIERLEQRQLLSASPLISPDAAAASHPAVVATAGKTVKGVERKSTGNVVLATFTDPGGAGLVSDYSATVIWGDGTAPDNSATIVKTGPNAYSVIDSHTYSEGVDAVHTGGKPYSIRVTVHRVDAVDTPSVYKFHTLDSPTGDPSSNYGINNNQLVTGLDTNPETFDSTGVVFKNGVGKLVAVPGAVDTETYQVNDEGLIAVSFFGKSSIYHAAVYDSVHHSLTVLPDVPGAPENLAGGITNSGLVVGDTFTSSSFTGGVGWTYQNGHYSFFTAPGDSPAQGGTATYSVNNQGQIVGYVFNSSGAQSGYVKTGATYAMLDYPGATGTVAYGINNEDVVTGSYALGGVQYGYLWYKGVFTDNGDLAGIYVDKSGNPHGFDALNVPAAVSDMAVTTADIADLPVIGSPLPNAASPVQGVSTGAVALAKFTDPGGAEAPSDYSATVNFHDGTPPAYGTISYDASTGYFTVTASHVYKTAGKFAPPTITVSHATTEKVVNDVNKVTVAAGSVAASSLSSSSLGGSSV
jgi:hypothetical protein